MHDLVIARINAFLAAFGLLNDSTNHSCTYLLTLIPRSGNVEQSLLAHFQGIKGYIGDGNVCAEGGWRLSLEAVDDWRERLRHLLSEWTFGEHFPELLDGQLFVKRNTTEWLLSEFDVLCGQSSAVGWILTVESERVFYDLIYEDFVLESNGHLYLLHLGFTD
jgi:hypothetical protein